MAVRATWCGDLEQHGQHQVCPGRPEPGAELTPEQFVAEIRGTPDDEMVPRMRMMREQMSRGRACFERNHEERLERSGDHGGDRLERMYHRGRSDGLSQSLRAAERVNGPRENTLSVYDAPSAGEQGRRIIEAIGNLPLTDDAGARRALVNERQYTDVEEPPERDDRLSYGVDGKHYRVSTTIDPRCPSKSKASWMRRTEAGVWQMLGCVCHTRLTERPDARRTVHLAIGNSDGHLSQADWADYQSAVDHYVDCLERGGATVHGRWASLPTAAYQNAAWCWTWADNTVRLDPEMTQVDLRNIAVRFGQESIAWNESVTQFLPGIKPTDGEAPR